jgi:hypothetical protein
MKDYLHRTLNLGDWVIIISPYGKRLKLGTVIKITDKKVRVKYGTSKYEEKLQDPNQVVKVAESDVTWFTLNEK